MVWSLGIMMFVMLCGHFPRDINLHLLQYKGWSKLGLSKDCCDLLSALLHEKPIRRLGLGQIRSSHKTTPVGISHAAGDTSIPPLAFASCRAGKCLAPWLKEAVFASGGTASKRDVTPELSVFTSTISELPFSGQHVSQLLWLLHTCHRHTNSVVASSEVCVKAQARTSTKGHLSPQPPWAPIYQSFPYKPRGFCHGLLVP
ncbi:hypothetical protein QQF64_006288 [Cirrhinus molitorella]|uniref:non-specific serine/threonine protein kinase n=1 Tax=Cirrhinus molitorella TaxID=172907 RepID=A0ABR3MHR3_9TELE